MMKIRASHMAVALLAVLLTAQMVSETYGLGWGRLDRNRLGPEFLS